MGTLPKLMKISKMSGNASKYWEIQHKMMKLNKVCKIFDILFFVEYLSFIYGTFCGFRICESV